MQINGENHSIKNFSRADIYAILEKFNLTIDRVALELNGEIIDKETVNEITLKEDDVLEIIHFVGGG